MTPITRSDELRYANRARVLACLRQSGSQSRKQLAEETGLSAATITQVTAQLLDEQIITESSKALDNTDDTVKSNPRGRPQVVLEMTADAALVATVTINFDWIEVNLFDYAGNLLEQRSSTIEHTNLDDISLLDQLTSSLQSTLQRASQQTLVDITRLRHITVACQGKVSKRDGNLLWSPLSQSSIINVGDHLKSTFGVAVSVDNDCNMIASALYHTKLKTTLETTLDTTRDISMPAAAEETINDAGHRPGGSNMHSSFAVVLVSYGIGLGLIHDGAILTGSRSSGTELGHMQISSDGPLCRCGKRGCIEAYAADYAIWRRAHGMRADQMVEEKIAADSMQQIFTAALAGDGIERQALREAGAAIGQGLANLFAIFDSFPTQLVGIDKSAATIVADAINARLIDSSDHWIEDIVTVHGSESETELIRQGAAMKCLDYVDQQIFSYSSLSTTTD